ncbi:MAG: hypothetical protein D6694_14970 [Gammaproteobacteria bacterium]|nr:MAG: hypothetical protein D6694_14970 [Gammaproteobacteria bacterium]
MSRPNFWIKKWPQKICDSLLLLRRIVFFRDLDFSFVVMFHLFGDDIFFINRQARIISRFLWVSRDFLSNFENSLKFPCFLW